MSKDQRPVVIVKKIKKGGHGHHGGSWKVAYADFVTAMMAFFMVMWLVGLDDETRRHIEQYFTHPVGFFQGSNSGDSPIGMGEAPAAAGDVRFKMVLRSGEERSFVAAADRIETGLDSLEGGLSQLRVEMVVGEDGLRIELLESGDGETYFARSSTEPQPAAVAAIMLIGRELSKLQNPVIIEGHTDAVPFHMGDHYTNWELSGDRANAARRILEASGVQQFRIREVRALGASRLRNQDDPTAAENRRISLILPFSEAATIKPEDMQQLQSQPRPGAAG